MAETAPPRPRLVLLAYKQAAPRRSVASERSGLRVVEEPGRPTLPEAVAPQILDPHPPLTPQSISEWFAYITVGGLLLAYLMGLAVTARWMLQWLFAP